MHDAAGRVFEIREGGLDEPAVAALLRSHLSELARISPPESMHALGMQALRAPEITFWSAWRGADAVGCGALKRLDAAHGEVKSMRTAPAWLRTGVATALLRHILDQARGRGYRRLSLETGASTEFSAAHALYEKFGFEECGPFDGYVDDPNSLYMTRPLRGT